MKITTFILTKLLPTIIVGFAAVVFMLMVGKSVYDLIYSTQPVGLSGLIIMANFIMGGIIFALSCFGALFIKIKFS